LQKVRYKRYASMPVVARSVREKAKKAKKAAGRQRKAERQKGRNEMFCCVLSVYLSKAVTPRLEFAKFEVVTGSQPTRSTI
jgi:hypothetical protein